ncbi:ATP-binding protein [Caballeronia sp. LZ034LL]|uniref:ATP-binding protein n=1 Tax=Caballeronia sp. LZ034LL TaxID=3038567 RepID=UPI00285F6AE2|nr:ATP-binding protein [Caballeronia sp. LZ034LL]MDR5836541.1 response regulator [Caballeronia sp. LZ034LL]
MPQPENPGVVMVLAPTGQDAHVITRTLQENGIEAERIEGIKAVCGRMHDERGVGVAGLVVTEEALARREDTVALAACLERQSPWSDLPICVLTVPGDTPSTFARWRLFETLGNVTLIARPLTSEALQSVARGILRARARQRQTMRHLEQLQDAAETLEQRVAERTEELMAAEETLRQAQKMEAIGQLTGGVAHDFNNLLQVVSSNMEVMKLRLRQGRLNDLDRHVQSAYDATQRAAALTHRLLAFSRRQTLDPKPVQPTVLIDGMLDLIVRTLGPVIKVRTRYDPALHLIMCDPHQLENALINLCINARDAMVEGGTLTITTENRTLDGREARLQDLSEGVYVVISVADDGCGMSPEVMSRAFDPFFTTKPVGQGTGLGLSMVYGFTRQSGGKVVIESAPDHGTTVHLYLPRLTDLPAATEIEQPRPALQPVSVRKTVLLVDDEPGIREVSAEVLKDAGFNVIEASDGLSGLSLLESDIAIDVLVTDIGMPGMNGKELADRARRTRPELSVLYITGYAEKAVFGNGNVEVGAHLLKKPFAMADLVAQVTEIIENSRKDGGGMRAV